MRRNIWFFPLALAACFICTLEVRANDWPACEDDNPEVSIAGCTKIIKAGKQPVRNIAGAHFFRGNTYLNKGDNERAIADYSKAIALNPKDADFYSNRSAAYFNVGKFDHAIADASKAIALKPENPGAYYNRGYFYNSIGNRERAIEDYSKAIELNSEDADFYANRGFVYFLQGDKDKALADYRKALELQPENEAAKTGLLMLGD
jgi:tetratricopeptide (TPR) repeat protein